jgi:hypothetical protein
MTLTELRDTLASVSDAVAVPTPDASAFEYRVALVRRRRTAVRVAGVLAAVAVGTGVVLLPGDDTSPPVVTPVEPADVVPVVLDGELALVGSDGATPTGVQVSGLVGQGENGVVTLDPQRHVVVVQLTDDGIGVVRDLSGEPVASAAVSADARVLVWVDEDRGFHERGTIDGSWTYETASGNRFGGVLLAVSGPDWLSFEEGRVMLQRPASGLDPMLLDSMHGVPPNAALAGDRAAIVAGDVANFYDTETGAQTTSAALAARGALSPTGELWASSDTVTDTTSGLDRVLAGNVRGVPVSTWWRDEQRYEAVTKVDGHRLLWDCSVTEVRCKQTYDDPTGTLALAG